MDLYKLVRDHRLRISFPIGRSESINNYNKNLCNTLFNRKTEWLFEIVRIENQIPFCCLAGHERIIRIALRLHMFSKTEPVYDIQKLIEGYNNGFQAEYARFARKVRSAPEFYQKEVASVIVNFPYGQSLYPYSIKDKRVVLFDTRGMIDFGEFIGRYFCAWNIVLDSQELYEPILKEYLNSNGQINSKSVETINGNRKSNHSDAPYDSRLHLNLNDKQLNLLYRLLLKNKFILHKTDKESFIWSLGGSCDSAPPQWDRIYWKVAKQYLREVLEGIKGSNLIAEEERNIGELFFDVIEQHLKLNKRKADPSKKSFEVEEILRSLKIESIQSC